VSSARSWIDHRRFVRLILHTNLIADSSTTRGLLRNLSNGLHDAADPDESELIVSGIRQNCVKGGHGIRVQGRRFRAWNELCGTDAGRREE
jgi:hypothetical protein